MGSFPVLSLKGSWILTHQRKPDDYLKIHVDLDELDLAKSESKATYAEIKSYVKDKTKGFMANE